MLLLGFNHFYRNKSKSFYSTQERSNNYKLALGYETQELMFVASTQLSRQIIFETVYCHFFPGTKSYFAPWLDKCTSLFKQISGSVGEQLLILEEVTMEQNDQMRLGQSANIVALEYCIINREV